ncbi:MAG: arginine--tRNA ligase [Candidatus Peribacteraceae bacterium]|nr:arginine--tRNA ligase [Candidatus Peribacteraceae bacterium]
MALTEKANAVVKQHFSGVDLNAVWTVPKESSFGDASLSLPLQLASKLKQKPRDVAQIFVDALTGADGIEKVEIAGAGYVNVWLTPAGLLRELSQTREACVPAVKREKERPVIVEYSQPNIAKPLGIHHILSTVVGQTISNLYRHLGYSTVAINHLGDWGTQFGKLAVAVEKWGKKPVEKMTLGDFLELYVRFHDEVEKDETLEDAARAAFRKLEEKDPALTQFWQIVVKTTMREVEAVYERLGIHFDHVHGESFYQEKMQTILDEGKKKGVFIEGEKGALIAMFPEKTGMPPAIVLKGDGSTIYHTRDLATIRYRIDTWHPQSLLYVVDVAQQLYFQQLFDMVRQLGWELPLLEHVVLGRMRFADRSMSTRKGNILRLQEVLDEAVTRAQKIIDERGDSIQTDDPRALAEMMGTGAVVYGIVSQNRKMDLIFDWDKMLSFEGNSAPYLQYTYARAKSVLRKAGAEGESEMPQVIAALTERERILIRTLLQFAAVLEDARSSHMPHTLANYLFGLCQDFNAFYNVDPIVSAAEPQRALRLALTSMTARVLKTGAEILTLRVPERM